MQLRSLPLISLAPTALLFLSCSRTSTPEPVPSTDNLPLEVMEAESAPPPGVLEAPLETLESSEPAAIPASDPAEASEPPKVPKKKPIRQMPPAKPLPKAEAPRESDELDAARVASREPPPKPPENQAPVSSGAEPAVASAPDVVAEVGMDQAPPPSIIVPPAPPRRAQDRAPAASAQNAAWAVDGQPDRRLLPEGTAIEVRFSERLSTETNRPGDRFRAVLENDVLVDDEVLFPKGTVLEGEVVETVQPGRVKGRAQMSFRLVEIVADDRALPITTNEITLEAESNGGGDLKKVGVSTAVGAAIGAIFGGKKGAAVGGATGAGTSTAGVLLTRGRHVEVERERFFSFRLEHDLVVEER